MALPITRYDGLRGVVRKTAEELITVSVRGGDGPWAGLADGTGVDFSARRNANSTLIRRSPRPATTGWVASGQAPGTCDWTRIDHPVNTWIQYLANEIPLLGFERLLLTL